MPYLQAVIKETLRMHPPATNRHWKIVPGGGATIYGTRAGWNYDRHERAIHHAKQGRVRH